MKLAKNGARSEPNDLTEDFFVQRKVTIRKNAFDTIFYASFTKAELTVSFP